jgi:hypothetical protein
MADRSYRPQVLGFVALSLVMALSLGACGPDRSSPRAKLFPATPIPTPTRTPTPTPSPTPAPQACSGQSGSGQSGSGQSLVGIDPINNVGYAPLIALDASGNAQIEAVNLTVGAASPLLATLSLPGASKTVATAYNPNNATILVETFLKAGGIGVFVISTATKTVTGPSVIATGLNSGVFSGILEDAIHNRAFVAGASTIGILDTSKMPPVWNAGSVVATLSTDSLSLNTSTGILFIGGEGNNQIIDTNHAPLVPKTFDSTFGITDGNAFDPGTNILAVTPEVGADQTHVFNFATLDTAVTPATANNITVPGLGEVPPEGEGPGGMAVINCETHQAVVADENGQNLKLLHLPTSPVPVSTPLNNKGQPGSGTIADAASAFAIAATVIPRGPGSMQLVMQGDPNSATIDPAHNFFYALALDFATETRQFLVRIDLSTPVPPLGASPTGTIHWTPAGAAAVITLP